MVEMVFILLHKNNDQWLSQTSLSYEYLKKQQLQYLLGSVECRFFLQVNEKIFELV